MEIIKRAEFSLTLQPTTSSKDLSLKGNSKRPATNFTLKIRSTASSILLIGTSPDSIKEVNSLMNSLYLKATITCICYSICENRLEKHTDERFFEQKIRTMSIPALIAEEMQYR
jgi:hypothetical protein